MTFKVQSYKISSFLKLKTEYLYRFCAIVVFSYFFLQQNYIFTQTKNKLNTIKTVCIDAGHGGKDPGCHGASSNEKTVCLNIALRLGAKIKEAFPDVKVIYTREKDVFVELQERAQFANRNKADLFICIHANSASASAFGAETYVLGLHRSGDQLKVAQRENSTIYLEDDKGEKYKNIDMSADAIIIRQLQLSVFLDHAILFATYVQSELKKLGRFDRGVKQDGFLVLRNTTMPAVLIETGFLTNAEEEAFLANVSNQDKMATAFFDAFRKYKAKMEHVKIDETLTVEEPVISEEKLNEEQATTLTTHTNQVFFKVQIETSETKLSSTSPRFKGLDVVEYKQDNLFKYTVGNFENNFDQANNYKNELRNKGFAHAFVVAFQNGERIPIDKALKLVKK